jgi:hypothetical protein
VVLAAVVFALATGDARGSPGWQWPLEGRVITAYANDDARPYAGGMHRGIDIAARLGTPVVAVRAGKVTYARGLGYAGLTVAVETADGYVTSYLHLGAVSVHRGDAVDAGARLGEVGTTGRRSKPEPHLHFGVRLAREARRYVDPLSLLPPLPLADAGAPPSPAPQAVPAVPRPVPVPAAARPHPAPTRIRPLPARRPAAGPAAAPAPVRLGARVPAPAPVPRPRAARTHPVPVAPHLRSAPVGARDRSAPARAPGRVAPPVGARAAHPARDWGRPLAIAGFALVALALFGRGAWRAAREANGALGERLQRALAKALRPARGYLPRWVR